MELPQALYKVILDKIKDGVYFTDKNRKILYWNKGAEELTGYKKEDIIGKYCYDNILKHIDENGKELCLKDCPLAWTIKTGTPHQAEVYFHHKDGHRVPAIIYCAPIFNNKNELVGAVEIFRDNSYVKSLRERIIQLEQAALLDDLTKLSNRRFLELIIMTKILETKRYHRSYGVIFIDVDNFKMINDTFGHNIGDRVLMMVASTLRSNVRFYDTVGRWGGDEFVLVIELKDEEDLKNITYKLRNLVEKSFLTIDDKKIQTTLSIGATTIKEKDTIESVINRADSLMYESKKRGKNNITIG